MKIAIGCDHAGYDLKNFIIKTLKNEHQIVDVGTNSSESVDYPDYSHRLANCIISNEALVGIIICGSGNGVSMAVNKHNDIRAALCWTVEISKLSRLHNDANVLALPARFITNEEAINIVNIFLETSFEGGRHYRRVNKINCE